jgi:hypothetical protein
MGESDVILCGDSACDRPDQGRTAASPPMPIASRPIGTPSFHFRACACAMSAVRKISPELRWNACVRVFPRRSHLHRPSSLA